MTNTLTTQFTPLTAQDRCDRCGAQAYLRVKTLSGFDLLFCAHHATKHASALKEVSVEWQDEREKLQS